MAVSRLWTVLVCHALECLLRPPRRCLLCCALERSSSTTKRCTRRALGMDAHFGNPDSISPPVGCKADWAGWPTGGWCENPTHQVTHGNSRTGGPVSTSERETRFQGSVTVYTNVQNLIPKNAEARLVLQRVHPLFRHPPRSEGSPSSPCSSASSQRRCQVSSSPSRSCRPA